jgi:hypothetical protein
MATDAARFSGGVMSRDAYLDNVTTFWAAVSARGDNGFRGGLRDEPRPGGWRPDPSGRHEFRLWDGTSWCAYVRDGDETSSDAFMTPTAPGWYPDPRLEHDLRYWDGKAWTAEAATGVTRAE